jgi:endo-1,4-beta-mannosidase
MWRRWDPARIDADFARIAGLGANAVRIIVHPDAFGYPAPDPDRLAELRRTVELAAAHRLTVQLTLFDWWGSYDDTAGSESWAQAVLAPYRDDPAIAFVEVKNEVDPSDPRVDAWLRRLLPVVREAVGAVPVTVSVTGPDPVARLRALHDVLAADPPDFYDLHYYGRPDAARATFEQAVSTVAPVALYIGETGVSSAPVGSAQDAEAAQARYLATVEAAAVAAGLPDAAPWIFQDIVPSAVPGTADRSPKQMSFGLLRADGTEKPAAAAIQALFTGPPAAAVEARAGCATGGLTR